MGSLADALLQADTDIALKSDTKMETLSYMPLQFEVPSTTHPPSSLHYEKTTPRGPLAHQQIGSCSGRLLHMDADQKFSSDILHFEAVSNNHHLFSSHYEKAVKAKSLAVETFPTSGNRHIESCHRVIGESSDKIWLDSARAGRPIKLFCPCPVPQTQRMSMEISLNAIYHIDIHITQLRIIPMQHGTTGPISIGLDDVLVVGPAEDFPLFFNSVERISDEDLQLAIVMQYISLEGRACRLCFLLGTQEEQKQFVSMFTSLCCSQSRYAHRTGEIDLGQQGLRF